MLAYDEETGEQAYKPVVQLFRNESKDWTGVTVNGKEIISTPGHKYYLPETKAWVSAEDLKVGYEVLTSDGEYATIKAVRPIHYKIPQTTYNFEVADFHTYYVGTGVLVHNKGCGDKPIEKHHIMTNKSRKYTAKFKKILKDNKLGEYGLNDKSNIIELAHRGRHTNAYHEMILQKVEFAARKNAGNIEGFRKAMKDIGSFLKENPKLLYRR